MFKDDKEYKFKKNDIRIYSPKIYENQQIDPNIIKGFPINKPMKFNEQLLKTAIKYGLVILLSYRGEKDKWKGGRERTIQPMVLGVNRNTKNMLLRGWHLEGWSVAKKADTKKVWRLFKTDNIISMTFTGNFFRLPPQGYKMNDRNMTERIIASADFNKIRINQDSLLKTGKIQSEDDTTIAQESGAVINIELTNTGSIIDMKSPFKNKIINKKNLDTIRFTNDPITKSLKFSLLKSVFGNKFIMVVGAAGTLNRQIKVYDGKKLLGNYKCIASFLGEDLPKNKILNNKSVFDLYVFNRKI
jgi:hypothetical protein